MYASFLQLKLYAESPPSLKRAKITDSYHAKACDKTIFMSTVEGNSRKLLIITICTSIATTVIATLTVLSVGMLIFCTSPKLFMESKCVTKLETHSPAIFALTIISIFANIYMFCLSWTALSAWEQSRHNVLLSDLLDFDEINYINRSSIGFLVVFNTISLFCSIIVVGLVAGLILLCFKNNKTESVTICKKKIYVTQLRMLRLVSVLCACLSICAHSPYIAIAYLNNEYHATGIFIYYSLLGCLLFGLSWIAFHYYYSISPSEGEMKDGNSGSLHKFWIIVALFFIIFITLIFVVILTCFFIMIPINKSISEFPNRITGIYMSGGFIISTFFVYKLVVYLCRKNRHRSTNPSTDREQKDEKKRKSTKKLEKIWRDRSDSEKKCIEYIALERIKDEIQKLSASLNRDDDDMPSTENSDTQREDANTHSPN